MDFNALLALINLTEKLGGHPRLYGIKTLVDAEIDKMQADSLKEVDDLAKAKAAAAAKAAAPAPAPVVPDSPHAIPAQPEPAVEPFIEPVPAVEPESPFVSNGRRI